MKTRSLVAVAIIAVLVLALALMVGFFASRPGEKSGPISGAKPAADQTPGRPAESPQASQVTVESPVAQPVQPGPAKSPPEEPVKTDEYPLGKPLANIKTPGVVPLELVRKIAEKQAADTWGKVALGPPLQCCDGDGNILAYMWPGAIDADKFPAYSAILASVKEGRTLLETGSPAKLAQGPADDAGRRKSIGEGTFGTVVVSGRYDQFPVPVFMHYLPPYYFNGDLAAQAASKALSAENVTLDRIYFLEGGHEQYFEFVWLNYRVLVHSYSLEVRKPQDVLSPVGVRRTMNPRDAADLANEWTKVTNEVR